MDENQAGTSHEPGRSYAYPAGRSRVAEAGSQRKLEHAETVHIEPSPARARQDWKGPRTLTLQRYHDGGYGFTLRYFVVYPPRCVYQKSNSPKESDFESCWSEFDAQEEEEHRPEPLDTFFVKNIVQNGPADLAGLTEGDRIVSVNGYLIGGKKYKDVVDLIQASTGDLKLGVVPRDEDILQLAYQEYVDDRASQGYSDGWKHVAADFDMQKPSANKWSTPVVHHTRKSSSGSGPSDGARAVKVKRYDPCVGFEGGAPVLSTERKTSYVSTYHHTDLGDNGRKISSSGRSGRGNSTDNVFEMDRERESSHRNPEDRQYEYPESRSDRVYGDNVYSRSSSLNDDGSRSSSINSDSAVTAEELTSRFAGPRTAFCSDSTDGAAFSSHSYHPARHAPPISNKIEREIAHVSNPGLVRRLAGTFNSGNFPRKGSVTSVLRNDFPLQRTSVLREDFQVQPNYSKDFSPLPSLTVTAGDMTARAEDFDRVVHTGEDMKFHLSVNVSEANAMQNVLTMSSTHDPRRAAKRGTKLSSLTSQATLVESQYLSAAQPSSGGSTSSEDSAIIGPEGSTITTITQAGPASKSVRRTIKLRNEDMDRRMSNRIGFVVTSNDHNQNLSPYSGSGVGLTATTKISSSSDVSDDDSNIDYKEDYRDTESASADEGLSVPEQSSWRGRRISYLMATSSASPSTPFKSFNGVHMEADDEDSDALNTVPELHRQMSEESVEDLEDLKNIPVSREGPLNKKMVQASDGRKRATIRGWKPVFAVLRGHILYCYKERSVTSSGYDDDRLQNINMKGSVVDIAHDYGKRKHVFRLATQGGSEYLFQAEDTQSMMSWVNALRDSNPDKEGSGGGYEDVIIRRMKTYENDSTGSSIPGSKNQNKKTLSLRKTHFMLGRSGTKKRNPVSVHIALGKDKEIQPSGITFGVPLEGCPPAKVVPNIPLIVEHCCQVVEEKGLECVGIYRVPGNAAAIQALQEELDTKDPDSIVWEEEKWHDLNNISSLLKSFLRKLPEPVIPKDMYEKFIQANRLEPAGERLKALKQQVRALPEQHYETLQFLIKHLKKVADYSDTNKMEPKNLAIVFGPTVVRTSEENMVTMVKDMSDQCRIIETMLQQCDWIYTDDETMEAVTIEPVEGKMDIFGRNNGIVASKGLLESLGQVAESMQGDNSAEACALNKMPQTTSKEGKGVASAIMSLTSFTTSFSMKLRNKAMSPMFSKKQKQETNPTSEDEFSESQDESTSPLTALRRLNTDPHGLLPGEGLEGESKQRFVKSDGEEEDEPYRVKAKIKQRGYVRALGPVSQPQVRKISPKSNEEVRLKQGEPSVSNDKGNANVMVPLKDGSPKDDSKKEFNFDAYKANMLSEKTRMRLIKVSMEHHAAMEQRQVERDRIDQELERTLLDLRQDDDDFLDEQLIVSPGRDSDDNLSSTSDSTNSSRKESIDSLSSPPIQRRMTNHSRQISGSSVSSEEKAPSYAINFRDMRKDFRKPQPIRVQPLQPPQAVQVEQITPLQPTEPIMVQPMRRAIRREIGEEEKRELEAFMGQFESSYEDESPAPEPGVASDSEVKKTPDRNLFQAKTLDQKLKILLDPSYQEKDGCLVKSADYRTETVDLSPPGRTEGTQRQPQQGPWVMSPSQERRSNFSASIRGIERPYKTKVIGINVPRSGAVGPTGAPIYGSEMAARIDTFKQKKQELEKKVSSILQESSKAKDLSPRDVNSPFTYYDDFRSIDSSLGAELTPDSPRSLVSDGAQDFLRQSDDLRLTSPRNGNVQGCFTPPPTQRIIVSAGNVQQTRGTPLQEQESNVGSSSNSQDRLDRNVQQVVELLSSSDQNPTSTSDSSDATLAALLSRLQRQKMEVMEPQPVAQPIPLSSPRPKINYSSNLTGERAHGIESSTQDRTRGRSGRDDGRTYHGRPDVVRVHEWRTVDSSPGLHSPNLSKSAK